MIMIKTLGRFILLLIVCLLLVYAPEILTTVSAPYSMESPGRSLLRIALCCEDAQIVSSIYKTVSAYQKEHPTVHLRITRTDESQLSDLREPYPDVIIVPQELSGVLPADALVQPAQPALCAALCTSRAYQAAVDFCSYIHESFSAQSAAADF